MSLVTRKMTNVLFSLVLEYYTGRSFTYVISRFGVPTSSSSASIRRPILKHLIHLICSTVRVVTV